MKQKFIIIALQVLLLVFAIHSPVVADVSNSKLLVPTTVPSLSATLITVYAADGSNVSVATAEVSITVTDGHFTNATLSALTISSDGTTVTGVTNSTGFFNIAWVSPAIPVGYNEISVSFSAQVVDNAGDTTINHNVVVRDTLAAISNSQLITPLTVDSNATTELQVLVQDLSNNPRANVSVEFNVPVGTYLSNFTGYSNTTGYFTTQWQAPALTIENHYFEIPVNATITVNEQVNLTLHNTITMNLTTSGIIVVMQSSDVVEDNNTATVEFLITDDSAQVLPTVEYTVQTSYGSFNGSDTASGTLIESSLLSLEWAIPALPDLQNVSAVFSVAAFAGGASYYNEFTSTVYANATELDVVWVFPTELAPQAEIFTFSFTTVDPLSTSAVAGVNVTLTTDLGFFTTSATDSISLTTDVNGQASLSLNFSTAVLIKAIQKASLLVNLEHKDFLPTELTTEIVVENMLRPLSVAVSTLGDSINAGADYNISLTATSASAPAANVSFQFYATGGVFSNGLASYVVSSDATGKLTIVWLSVTLAGITSPVNVTIVITSVSSEYMSFSQEVTVQVLPMKSSTISSNASPSSISKDDSNALMYGLGVGIIAGATVVAVLVKRKS